MKPCLVIGSGFHSWVLGKSNTSLSSWNVLINEVAEVMSIAVPSRSLGPVLRWEKLLENAANDGFRSHSGDVIDPQSLAAHKIELIAKKVIANVLSGCNHTYPSFSSRSQYPLSQYFGSVISLNFDHCWIGNADFTCHPISTTIKMDKIERNEIARLNNYITPNSVPSMKIWYPNGSVLRPETIRMGLYDYGSKPHAIKCAFKRIKQYERSNGSEDLETYLPILENAFSAGKQYVNNWVAEFLYRPIYFAGVGLSESETGLWWLLTQRARNFAKLNSRNRPPTVILINDKDSRRKFWENRPCGIEALVCKNWDVGWEMITDRVNPPPMDGGQF